MGKKEKSKSKHKVTKKYKYYTIEGDNIKRNKNFCPKCGPGVFLGERKANGKIIYFCGFCFLSIERKE
jgi:small subunit ribosomal protein S27Ae